MQIQLLVLSTAAFFILIAGAALTLHALYSLLSSLAPEESVDEVERQPFVPRSGIWGRRTKHRTDSVGFSTGN